MKSDNLLPYKECYQRCLFQDAKVMASFIPLDTKIQLPYLNRRALLLQKQYHILMRLSCKTALEHFYSLYALFLLDKQFNKQVGQHVWSQQLLDQSESLMRTSKEDPYIVYLRAQILFTQKDNKEALSILATSAWQTGQQHWSIWRLFADHASLEAFDAYFHTLNVFYRDLALLYMGATRHIHMPLHRISSFVQAYPSIDYIQVLYAAFHANQNIDYTIPPAIQQSPFYLDLADVFSHRFFACMDRESLRDLQSRADDDYKGYLVKGNYNALIQHPSAISWFEKAHSSQPQNPLPLLLMGFEYYNTDKQRALECYYDAYSLDQTDHRVLYALGYYYEKERFFEKAISFYEQLVEMRPQDTRFLMALGECHGHIEAYGAMLHYCQLAYTCEATALTSNACGIACRSLGKHQMALDYFIKALEEGSERFMRIQDVLFCIKECAALGRLKDGKCFMRQLHKYANTELYANEMAILEERLNKVEEMSMSRIEPSLL